MLLLNLFKLFILCDFRFVSMSIFNFLLCYRFMFFGRRFMTEINRVQVSFTRSSKFVMTATANCLRSHGTPSGLDISVAAICALSLYISELCSCILSISFRSFVFCLRNKILDIFP